MSENKSLSYEAKNGWQVMSDSQRKDAMLFCNDYIQFLNDAKTEREAVQVMVEMLRNHGFTDFSENISGNKTLQPGDKVYWVNREKALLAAVIGKQDPTLGMNMVGAHIDAPRLDFKPNPLCEDGGFVLAKTHYYGGIKKYQWVAVPLALHGVVIRKDGTKLELRIGEAAGDPVFYISDLLPHLASDQMGKTGAKVVAGEQLQVVLGSIPDQGEDEDSKKNSLKENLLKLIYECYEITESDFLRAEIEIVPAFRAGDVGLDRSLVGGYGQDDRVCAYTGLRALTDMTEVPEKTAVCYLSDKEEIGSVGNTGARANWLENFVLELCHAWNPSYEMVALRRALSATRFLSADVTAAYDPCYPEVYEKGNTAYAGGGVAIAKYTGSRGKSGASDASAELVASVVDVFDGEDIPWQVAELGKVDAGGGGTIAQFMTDIGMDVLDCGVPVISMHSPYEVTSKADVYWTYRAYGAFMK